VRALCMLGFPPIRGVQGSSRGYDVCSMSEQGLVGRIVLIVPGEEEEGLQLACA
jgi:hypothetical protein